MPNLGLGEEPPMNYKTHVPSSTYAPLSISRAWWRPIRKEYFQSIYLYRRLYVYACKL